MTVERPRPSFGTLPVLARFSTRAFGKRSKSAECSIPIEQLRNGHKAQESARKRYERVGASLVGRNYTHPLLQAVEDQHYERCRSLIEGGVDISVKDKETGCSAVHIAAKQENCQILHMLLENGADCNAQDDTEQAPLHLAIKKDHLYNTQALLQRQDLNINISNRTNDTPLHVAAKEGRYEICKLVLQCASVKVNLKNKKGLTAMHYAAQENHTRILQLLLDNDADWNVKDNVSFLPVHYAASKGYPDACQILLSHQDSANKVKQLTSCAKDGKTPLMLAAKQGFHKCCTLMQCQNVNARDKDGNTALHLAAINGFEATLSILLEMGANSNTQNKKGIAPIHDAAAKRRVGCLQVLLEKNANLNVFDKQGRCALHYAAEKNALDTLKFMLDSAVESDLIDKKDNNHCAPLHIAIKKDAVDCAILLLEKGASPIIECAGGMTPLHLAADKGSTSLCEVLLSKKEVEVSRENELKATPLHMAALHGSADVCQMLIRKGARLTALDAKGRTALHVASSEGTVNAVKYLSKKGIPLRAKDDTGSCALHLAASRGSLECCKILVRSAKATLWEVDHTGMMPLDRAFKDSQNDTLKEKSITPHDQVFQYLLENLTFKEKNEELMLRIHKYMEAAMLEKRVVIIEAIVNSSWWHAGITGENGQQCLNFRKLIENYPELALKLMDKCITPLPDSDSKVVYDFKLLEDSYYIQTDTVCIARSPFDSKTHRVMPEAVPFTDDSLEWKRNHPLSLMISHQRLKMLSHPLTKMWLLQKWISYIHWIFLISLLIEALFTVCLTFFMGKIDNWNHVKNLCNSTEEEFFTQEDFCKITNASDSVCHKISSYKMDKNAWQVRYNIWMILLVLTVLIIGKELYSFWRLKKQYLFYLEHTMRILRLIFTIPIFIYSGSCEYKYMILDVPNWQCGILALLLTWLHFINALNQLPKFSIFMPVTSKFIKSFFKVLTYIIMIVFVFAFIFHLLLRNQKAFSSLSQAMVKTAVWMLQDLAYDNTFIFNTETPLMYPTLVRFLFLVFVAFLGGFFVNFIITQPSNQLDSFRESACFHRAASRAELFFKLDVCFPYFRRVMTKVKIVDDSAKNSDYITRKILMLDTREEVTPEAQLDVLQKEIEKQNKQIQCLITLYTEEMNDLKHQVTVLTKTLTK